MKNKILYILLSASILSSCDKDNGAAPNVYNGGTGQGGSLARFTTASDHLYVADEQKIFSYSISDASKPSLKSTSVIGRDIETIYSYNNKLFVGSRDAMYIYSLDNPDYPARVGQATHVRGCDPVVAKDNYAYVTIRNGSTCGDTRSVLMVYDVTYITNPSLRKEVSLQSPYGLGIRNNRLYVCDGANGLKVFDISSPTDPVLIKTFNDEMYMDVIPVDNMLVCMVQGGTVIYEYDAAAELLKKSKIAN